jgi:LacI family transcriptional regulator
MTAKLFIETMHNNEDMSSVEKVLKPKLFIREYSQRLAVKKTK